jgi:hypothetical protein
MADYLLGAAQLVARVRLQDSVAIDPEVLFGDPQAIADLDPEPL